ncbi:MAG TPA: hypothetical protein VG962_07760 [Steroidobacteraceae bacterium]|nr:hypothetical protein [Steroidobacteraceae bacterium]
MKRFLVGIALITSMLATGITFADGSKAGNEVKAVGRKAGEAVHEVGAAGKEVGKKVVKVAREVGHATREGAREFHKAVTGKSTKQTAHHSASSVTSSTGK